MPPHLKGLLITTLGVLLVTPDSLFVRVIEAAPMEVAFWRSVMSGILVGAFVLGTQGPRAFGQLRHSGWPGVIYTVLIGSTAPAFVLAVTQTSVANVVFIFASMPVFAALFSWIGLGERISRRMIVTMGVVIAGLGVIAYGSGTSEIASWRGDIWAFYVSAAYAAALTAVRRVKAISMVPAIPLAYLGAALVLWGFGAPFAVFGGQWMLFVAHGALIGAAAALLTLGPRYISSAEVSLLVLLESVLAPILVWAVVGEEPGPWALAGGSVVIAALVVSNLLALRRSR